MFIAHQVNRAYMYLAFLYLETPGLASRCLLGRGKSCCLLTTPAGELTDDLPMRGTLRTVGPIPKTAPRSAIDEITAPPVVNSLKVFTPLLTNCF